MTIMEKMQQFISMYSRTILVGHEIWRYYRLGVGRPILWLTGGLRRAALGYSFLEALAENHTIIAPDYPPTRTIDEFIDAFDAILEKEQIRRFILAGQSYGSLLAQVYLAKKPGMVDMLVISSGGPADYGHVWLVADYLAMGLVRLLPEKSVKLMLTGGLLKTLSLPNKVRGEWLEAVQYILDRELTRADVYSHFAVAADWINKKIVQPEILQQWKGRVIVLSAGNDPTQSEKDFPRYERLFGRPVERVNLGNMGHGAMLFSPKHYLTLFENALAEG